MRVTVRAALRTGAAAVATSLVATALALVGAPPAAAALCSGGDGVGVVVSYGALGGGTRTGCGSGDTAAAATTSAGFALEYAARQPGFVCRVTGVPQSDPCVHTSPTDAYWGLFWTDGTSGTWHYATLGAGALKVPAGGAVGWAWQDGGDRDYPAVAAPVAQQEPAAKPKSKPTRTSEPKPRRAPRTTRQPKAETTPTPTPTTQRPSAAPTPTDPDAASGPKQRKQRKQRKQQPTASASPTASAGAEAGTGSETAAPMRATEPAARTTDDGGPSGLPWWVPGGLLLALVAGAGIAVRRRGTGSR